MKKLTPEQMSKLRAAVNQLKGKRFTISDSRGKKYRMEVMGIKGNYLVMRQVGPRPSGAKSSLVFPPFFPFFFFPLPFFFPFFFF